MPNAYSLEANEIVHVQKTICTNDLIMQQFQRCSELEHLVKLRNWKFEFSDNFFEVQVIDGQNRSFQVSLLDPQLIFLSCNCQVFSFEKIDACLHTKAVNRLFNENFDFKNSISLNYHNDKPVLTYDFNFNCIRLISGWRKFIPEQYGLEWDEKQDRLLHIKDFNLVKSLINSEIKISSSLLKILLDDKTNNSIVCNIENINNLKSELFPFQELGVTFLSNQNRVILADEMGLGKAVMTLSASKHLYSNNLISSVLIVCPVSLKDQWSNEIAKFTDFSSKVINSTKEFDEFLLTKSSSLFVIMNYELIQKNILKFKKEYQPELIVLDEVQRIRNFETKTWKAIKQLKSKCLYMLSGTVIENRLDDLFNLMSIIDSSVLGPKWKFDAEFTERTPNGRVRKTKNFSSLKKKLKPYLLRRTKRQVMSDLPPVTEIFKYIELTPEQLKLEDYYRNMANKILSQSSNRELSFNEKQIITKCLLKARQACDSSELCKKETVANNCPKLDELEEMLKEICLNEEGSSIKVIVFSEWIEMLNFAQARCNKLGLGSILFTGQIKSQNRQKLIDNFFTDNKQRVFLSTDAGGLGLNLQKASNIIHLDLPWNPAKLDQRNGRVDRIGQKENVFITYLIAKSGLERGIERILNSKRQVRLSVLDSDSEVEEVTHDTFNTALVQILKDENCNV